MVEKMGLAGKDLKQILRISQVCIQRRYAHNEVRNGRYKKDPNETSNYENSVSEMNSKE